MEDAENRMKPRSQERAAIRGMPRPILRPARGPCKATPLQLIRGVWSLEYDTLVALRREHPGWKLLAADHAPLVVSVLYRHFVQPNVRALPRNELISRLDDELFHLNDELGERAFPQSAAHYLDDWAADAKGWLRKYYPPGTDEPHYDVTPATEKVIDWIAQLGERHFVGTESRLLTVFELLR